MIRAGRGIPEASLVELRRGDVAIVARVIWREGSRAGLLADVPLPVAEILSLTQATALQLVGNAAPAERRAHPRREADHSRFRGKLLEFVSIAAIGASLAVTLFGIVEQALTVPMQAIRSGLAG